MNKVDASGKLCPMPLILAQEFAKKASAGTQFVLVATDPGVHEDIPAWCRMHGHQIVSTDENASEIRMTIELAAAD